MATIRLFAFMFVVIATVELDGTYGITCYSCVGDSGIPSNAPSTLSHCGLPFQDNAASPLTTVTCTGVCVTQVGYSAGMEFFIAY